MGSSQNLWVKNCCSWYDFHGRSECQERSRCFVCCDRCFFSLRVLAWLAVAMPLLSAMPIAAVQAAGPGSLHMPVEAEHPPATPYTRWLAYSHCVG